MGERSRETLNVGKEYEEDFLYISVLMRRFFLDIPQTVLRPLLDEWQGCLIYQFDTAWSPPMEFLQAVAKQLPALTCILEYEEPGMAYKGLAKFQGEHHEDHCISL